MLVAFIRCNLGTLSSCVPWSAFMARGLYPSPPGPAVVSGFAEVLLFSVEAQTDQAAAHFAGSMSDVGRSLHSVNVDRFYDPAALVREPTWSAVADYVLELLAFASDTEIVERLVARGELPGEAARPRMHLPPQAAPVERSPESWLRAAFPHWFDVDAVRRAELRRRRSRERRRAIVNKARPGGPPDRLAEIVAEGFQAAATAWSCEPFSAPCGRRCQSAARAAEILGRLAEAAGEIPRGVDLVEIVDRVAEQVEKLAEVVDESSQATDEKLAEAFEALASAFASQVSVADQSGRRRYETAREAASILGRLAAELSGDVEAEATDQAELDESTIAQGRAAVREPVGDPHRPAGE